MLRPVQSCAPRRAALCVGRVRALGRRRAGSHATRSRDHVTPLRYVIVDAKNGLGNRLRALASAMAVAAALERPLMLVWVADLHCNCSFRNMFAAVDLLGFAQVVGFLSPTF